MIKETVDLENCYKLQFDGGAVPNPGRACGAFVLFSPESRVIMKGAMYLEKATNNQAEYTGLLYGLEKTSSMNIKNIAIEGDSMLVIKQAADEWKVRNTSLISYHTKIKELLKEFDTVYIKHISREMNSIADSLADEGIIRQASFEIS